AVEREPDPDGRLHSGPVDDGKRPWHPQTHRAHLRVRLSPEDVGATAEHLRRRGQLHVHLKTQYRVVALQDLVVVHYFGNRRHFSSSPWRHVRTTSAVPVISPRPVT